MVNLGNFKNSTCLLTTPKPYENDHTDTNSINSIARVWGNGTPADSSKELSGHILSTDAHFKAITSFDGMAGTKVVSPSGRSIRVLAGGTIVTIHNPDSPVLNPSREWIRVDGWRAEGEMSTLLPKIEYISPYGERSSTLTSPFAYRFSGGNPNSPQLHAGIDLQASGTAGTPIFSIADGEVVRIGLTPSGGWGNYVVMRYKDPAIGYFLALYAHLHRIANGLIVGTKLRQGDEIGTEGGTPDLPVHLHFETWRIANKESSVVLNSPIDALFDPFILYGLESTRESIDNSRNLNGGRKFITNPGGPSTFSWTYGFLNAHPLGIDRADRHGRRFDDTTILRNMRNFFDSL